LFSFGFLFCFVDLFIFPFAYPLWWCELWWVRLDSATVLGGGVGVQLRPIDERGVDSVEIMPEAAPADTGWLLMALALIVPKI
jgi:hypothetical protein